MIKFELNFLLQIAGNILLEISSLLIEISIKFNH